MENWQQNQLWTLTTPTQLNNGKTQTIDQNTKQIIRTKYPERKQSISKNINLQKLKKKVLAERYQDIKKKNMMQQNTLDMRHVNYYKKPNLSVMNDATIIIIFMAVLFF